MIKYLFTSAILFWSLSSIAQNEYFEGDPRWQIYYSCFWGTGPMDYHNIYDHFIGETEINGHIYKILESAGGGAQMTDQREYVRSEGKKIYAINPSTNQEDLMYDFDAEIGDTLEVSPNMYLGVLVVQDITFVTINGQERKVFTVVDSENGNIPMAPVLIEGIGNSISGLFGFIFGWFDCGITPICYSVNDTSYTWENSWDYTLANFQATAGVCALADDIEEARADRPEIFPNPVIDHLHLKNLNSTNSDVRIVNTLGEIVFSGKITSAGLDIQNLDSGYYVLMIETLNQKKSLPFIK